MAEYNDFDLTFEVAQLIHSFVAHHKLNEGSRIVMTMSEVTVEDNDHDKDDLDSTYKYAENIRIVIEV